MDSEQKCMCDYIFTELIFLFSIASNINIYYILILICIINICINIYVLSTFFKLLKVCVCLCI